MYELWKAFGSLLVAVLLGALVYAGCVIWPFKFNPTIGWVLGGLAVVGILIPYIVGLDKRLREARGDA
jgi:hypothetical protein